MIRFLGAVMSLTLFRSRTSLRILLTRILGAQTPHVARLRTMFQSPSLRRARALALPQTLPPTLLTILLLTTPASGRELSIEERLDRDYPFNGIPVSTMTSNQDSPAQIGLYIGRGTWETGKEHLKLFFKEISKPFRTLEKEDLISGDFLEHGLKILIIPGGRSWEYLEDLGPEAAKHIKKFIHDGGSYIGICAGAFYATSFREGGVATGPYGIGLLEGTAYDGTAFQTPPFIEGMMDFDLLIEGFKSIYRMVLLGGPSFRYSQQEASAKEIEVLARFQQINEPAMIRFRYGLGKVFLTGPHLEVEENLTDWGADYQDPESDWPLLEHVMESIWPHHQ